MKSVIQSSVLKQSVVASVLLFISAMYAQKVASELTIFFSALIELVLIGYFIVIFIYSLIFWLRKNKSYSNSFVPFFINVFVLALIIVLPLNYIRNMVEFQLNHKEYEHAYDLIIKSNRDTSNYLFKLPAKYESLSAGGGEAWVMNKSDENAVLFFTFKGILGSESGFLKVSNKRELTSFIYQNKDKGDIVKDLGDNWFYISIH